MECPHCGGRFHRQVLSNGKVILKCEDCGHEEETPDLESPLWDSLEAYGRNTLLGR